MTEKIFLDTDVILDYLENRNQEVRDTIAQLLLFHKKGHVVLTTSIFNVAELIDKEFQICFIGECMMEKMSSDEILNKLSRDKEFYRQRAKINKDRILKKINNFILKNGIEILFFPFSESQHYTELYELIYDCQLRSQDALIIWAALLNDVSCFLTNDSDLANSISGRLNTFNLRDVRQRETFRDYVLKPIVPKVT